MARFINMAKSGRMAAHRRPAPGRVRAPGATRLTATRGKGKPAAKAGPRRSRRG